MMPANSAASELIYDVGAENGDDSAYYLRLGYKVVGVEANPLAAAALECRFAAELADGRYALVPKGIAAEPGEAPFWICDDEPGRRDVFTQAIPRINLFFENVAKIMSDQVAVAP